ncbi:4-(cytidine 5'-diphospho)-2-C-methyl-D-erythritol kinase [Candidatus Omnitrophota bacterium]
MKQVQTLAPAKINLFLRILNKRRDGYHNIETVFEKVSLFDKLILKDNVEDEIVVRSSSKDPCFRDENNTVYRAIELVKKKLGIRRGVVVYLEKNIPVGAGLGGGSSDAVAVLKGLNRLWRLGLSQRALTELSQNIGSDVPLFVSEDNFLLGKGRGELLYRIPGTKNLKLWHILVVPDFRISTLYAYSLFDRHFLSKKISTRGSFWPRKLRLTIPAYNANIITRALLSRDVALLNYYSYNSFRSLILRRFARLSGLNRTLENINRDFVHLSGSGSTLFMTFSNRKGAENLVEKIKKAVKGCSIYVVHTC